MSSVIAVGTNHKYSPIEIRERLSFSKRRLNETLSFLLEFNCIKGAVILSTCNRVEIYADVYNIEEGFTSLIRFLARHHEIDTSKLAPYLYRYEGKGALRHLFEVACGLDSQVLGETQILGQVRFFFEEAKRFGYAGGLLDGAFSAAIEVGKLVRIETEISKGSVSIGSVAIALIKKEIKELRNKKILIIGLGKISNLVIKYLSKERVSAIIVSNRTYEKAIHMARAIGGGAIKFDKLKENLKGVDIIISATSSPHVVLKKEDILKAFSFQLSANSQKLLIVDLALPRDIDPRAREIEWVRLFNLDDLKSVIESNIEKRKREAERAHVIIEEEVRRLWERFIALRLRFSANGERRRQRRLSRTIRIGTRTSPLALKQVDEVTESLKRLYPEIGFEVIGIDTYGDKDKATPISDVEGSDFFTREIEDALLKGEIDFAVHSAKDLPDMIPEGLHIAALTGSIDPYDALVSKGDLKLDELPCGAKIGTSSLRRKAQLKSYRDDFEIVDIRGNIEERLRLLDGNGSQFPVPGSRPLDAIVIAACALVRLGLEDRAAERIPFEILKPHPLQGSLAIEARKGDRDLIELLAPLDTLTLQPTRLPSGNRVD